MDNIKIQIEESITDHPKTLRQIVQEIGIQDFCRLVQLLDELGAQKDDQGRFFLDNISTSERMGVRDIAAKDKKIHKLNQQLLDYRKQYQQLLSRVKHQERLEAERESLFWQQTNVAPMRRRNVGRKEATPLVLASDWHPFKIVEERQTDGRNRFNADIARERVELFFQKIAETNEMMRHSYDISQLVLWLGGDLMENWLHDGNARFTEGTPSYEVAFARDLIEEGIQFLLSDESLDLIHVPCSVGNHGRFPNSKKVSVPDPVGESMEWLLYEQLAHFFQDEPRVQFSIPKSEYTYFYVYDWLVRASHGFQVKVSKSQPIEKSLQTYISDKNQTEVGQIPDLDIIGHIHTLRTTLKGLSNGSVVGEDPFANRMRFIPEPPQQAYKLIERDAGPSFTIPLALA